MFGIYKQYLKWKLIALIQAKLAVYLKEKYGYIQRQKEWECKEYKENKCLTKERFEENKKEQIRFSNEQYKKNQHIYDAVADILKIIEDL